MNVSYVTYDPETGELLGGFMQAAPDDGTLYLEVDGDVRMNWFLYRMNAERDGVELIPLAPPPPPTVLEYRSAVQGILDAKAQERQYDNILSACTYALDSHPTFQAEGRACVDWRGAVWSKCYEVMSEVEANTRPQPTIAELLDLLPTMEWPA